MSMPIPPIGPLTGLRTSKSFSWTFAIDVDTALGAVAQFDTFDEDLTQADTFIRGALGLMSHQSARCVFDILLDYSQLSDACDTVNHQADKLKEALSTYGAAMNTVRDKYKDLIAFAQTAGLSVVGGLVWFCGPGVLRVVGCYWWCCAHWRAYWLGESQPSALWGCSSL